MTIDVNEALKALVEPIAPYHPFNLAQDPRDEPFRAGVDQNGRRGCVSIIQERTASSQV